MRKSLKAALFSGLVFPGSGHFVLRKYVRGALLAGISIACLYALVSIAVEIAQEISDQILSGEIPLDAARITHEVTSRSAGDGSRLANLSTYLLVACWLVGIVDSWRVGRLLDKSESSAKSESQHEES
jgi:hypothetical protein